MSLKPGTRVTMTEEYKQSIAGSEHLKEFGDCEGIVEGPVDYGTFQGPELDVRWEPSKLRYGYHPDHLKVIHEP